MDGTHFDRLTQQFGHALSRRRFGVVLAALGLGAGFGAAPKTKAKKKKKKKRKPAPAPNPCANGTVKCGADCVDTETDTRHCGACGVPCNVGRCVGGECIECEDQYGCGGYASNNDLVCRGGRCVCEDEDHGLCQRYSDRSGRCHQCCPGGNGECRFDEICFYDPDFQYGPLAYCDCPTGWQRCNYNPHPSGTCVQNPQTDSRKCGPYCEDCTANTEFPAICCNGTCTRGCGGPGTVCYNQGQPCGPNCLPCNSDSICCNMGPRSLPRCIPNVNNSNVCYQN